MLHHTSWGKIRPFFTRIVFVWAMVFGAIVVYSFAWFSMGSMVMTFIDAITGAFTFDARWDSVVQLIKNVILWHPIISLFGWVLWGFLNSMRRDVRTWET